MHNGTHGIAAAKRKLIALGRLVVPCILAAVTLTQLDHHRMMIRARNLATARA